MGVLITMLKIRRGRVVVRGAFDIGSGATKLCVARVRVDRLTGKTKGIVEILFNEQTGVLLRSDMAKSTDGRTMSDGILKRCEACVSRYQKIAIRLGAEECAGVATAVFRKAANGETFLRDVLRKKLGVKIDMIDQKVEGRIGWLTAVAALRTSESSEIERTPTDRVIMWDSGGGSFQIVDAQGRLFGAHHGSATVTAAMLDVQERRNGASTNPASDRDVRIMIERLLSEIPDAERTWLSHTDPRRRRFVAIGGETCAFRICKLACHKSVFTPEDVRDSIKRLIGKTDQDLVNMGFPQVDMTIPKLCLIYCVMQKAGVDRVHYIRTNGSTLGILMSPSFWLK